MTDQTMPAMTGLTLSTRMKEIRTSLPTILMTGNNLHITEDKLSKAGIAEVLLKPISLGALGAAVQRALKTSVSYAAGDKPRTESIVEP